MALKEVGFLGLGIMGTAMARNLLKGGIKVTVWNRTAAKCDELVAEGAAKGESPADVVRKCDVTIAILADPAAALATVFGENGVLEGVGANKSYIDMSTVDGATSTKISEAIVAKGGRFLEAPVSGSKGPAIAGQLVILCAGSETLFEEATPALSLMGKKSFYLGEVGAGARMKLVVNMVMGAMTASLAEGLTLADKSGLSQQTLLDVLDLGALANPLFKLKGPSIIKGEFPPAFPLKHQQKDLRLALALAEEASLPLPVAAAANETFKQAKSLGLGDMDMSAVYKAVSQQAKLDS